jgi:hypothetical protein
MIAARPVKAASCDAALAAANWISSGRTGRALGQIAGQLNVGGAAEDPARVARTTCDPSPVDDAGGCPGVSSWSERSARARSGALRSSTTQPDG